MNEAKMDDCEIISLAQAAKDASFTPEYMNLLARTGKLKAKKLGRNWVTTRKWLNEYLAQEKRSCVAVGVSAEDETVFNGMAKLYFELMGRDGEKGGGGRDGFLRIRTSLLYLFLLVIVALLIGVVLYYLHFRNLNQ